MKCWLASVGLLEVAAGQLVPVLESPQAECQGRIDRCHLIKKSEIKARFPLGATLDESDAGVFRPVGKGEPWAVMTSHIAQDDLISDPHLIVPGCRRHHHLFDVARKLRIPRESIPQATEQWAWMYGMGWWLDREYGPRLERVA